METLPFNFGQSLKHIAHFLPHQAALKDFVHHNTLHAFQNLNFHQANKQAADWFGFQTYLPLNSYRELFRKGRINPEILFQKARERQAFLPKDSNKNLSQIEEDLIYASFSSDLTPEIGKLRKLWKERFQIQLEKITQPILFRLLSNFLDQGVAIWEFPSSNSSFLEAIRFLEKTAFNSIFKTDFARELLFKENLKIEYLLNLVVGDERFFERYLFDQQFQHSGWSGFVSVLEHQPSTLLKQRKIDLSQLVIFETLLEVDALVAKFGKNFQPLLAQPTDLNPKFQGNQFTEYLFHLLGIWQEAYEWSYFDVVLCGLKKGNSQQPKAKQFQALFCIDDRSYSLRRNLENQNKDCATYGTPGFFGLEFYFQPDHGKFSTKCCPAPVEPKFLIKEFNREKTTKKHAFLSPTTHGLFGGLVQSIGTGWLAGAQLFRQVFAPNWSEMATDCSTHMDPKASLQILTDGSLENGLQVGFTVEQMAERVGNVLRSIGLTSDFAPIVYIIGHGASSVNNPYYAGYDCGACCGRPGSVNARIFAQMANRQDVRSLLAEKGVFISEKTVFIGGLHDTTRDKISFFDLQLLSQNSIELHSKHHLDFAIALENNAVERSLRFQIPSNLSPKKIHESVKRRAVSLFELRPEWNHTDNALCIVGGSNRYAHLFLDKRPFVNSYNHASDPEGKILSGILGAAVPVCGGINLEYYYSHNDQVHLGAGTKLPQNVVGLFGVNHGVDGDLRTGLPKQMIEIHEAIRILFVIEQKPDIVLNTIEQTPNILSWLENKWVVFSVIHPETNEVFVFNEGRFEVYEPQLKPTKFERKEQYKAVVQHELPVFEMGINH